MARDYGNDRVTNTAVRLSQQEKEQLKAEAYKRGITISALIRQAVAEYLEEARDADSSKSKDNNH